MKSLSDELYFFINPTESNVERISEMILCLTCFIILIVFMLFKSCKQDFEVTFFGAIPRFDIYHQIFVLYILVALLVFFFFYFMARGLKKQTFYSKFVMFQRFRSNVLRYYDYYSYWIYHQFRAQPVKFIVTFFESFLKVYFLTTFITLLTIFLLNILRILNILDIVDNMSIYSNLNVFDFLINSVGFVLIFRDWLNSNSNYTNIQKDEDVYQDVEPPDEWNRLILTDNSSKSDRKEYVYFNNKINKFLQGTERISICRNYQHEENLKKQLSNEYWWNATFYPFLHQKYRETGYTGSLFYNEDKFGLSEDPEQASVYVHKTCYFDTYLTNIIPGNMLVRNCDKKVFVKTEELMPYRKEKDSSAHPKKILYKMNSDGVCRSNEVGISTLFLIDGAILFWEQSPYAQSSVNRIAPSGSGSADWDDCKYYFNEPNGLRKAVVYGMQRELWEESYSYTNQVSMKHFMNHAETRIIGYFRWLEKSAKPEFIGVTRICPNNPFESRNYIVPEFMEVKEKKYVKAKTIGEFLFSFRNTVVKTGNSIQIDRHSVPSAMAIYFLKDICKHYCENCYIGIKIIWKKKIFKSNKKNIKKSFKKRKIFNLKEYVYRIYECQYKCPRNLQDILFSPDTSIQVKEH